MKKALFIVIGLIFLVGCAEDPQPEEEAGTSSATQDAEETIALEFRNMDLQQEANTFELTGEVYAEDQVFYYHLEQGEIELWGEETYELEGEGGDWQTFEITGEVPASAFDEEGTPVLKLYGKSADGETIHPNFVPIDIGAE